MDVSSLSVRNWHSSPQPLATAEEVAQYTGGSAQTLAVWRMKGIGPRYIRMGRQVRYRWDDVETWLDAQSSGGLA